MLHDLKKKSLVRLQRKWFRVGETGLLLSVYLCFSGYLIPESQHTTNSWFLDKKYPSMEILFHSLCSLYNSSSPIELCPSGVNGNMLITPPIQGFRLISDCDIPGNHYEDGPDPMILNRNHLQGQKRKINLQADAPIPHDHISDTMLKIILITFFILIVGFIGRVFLRQMFQHPVIVGDCYHRWQNIWNWIRNRNGDDTAEQELESQNQPTENLEPQNQPIEDLEPQNQPTQDLEPQNQPTEDLEPQNQPTQDLEPQNQPTEDLEPQNQSIQDQE